MSACTGSIKKQTEEKRMEHIFQEETAEFQSKIKKIVLLTILQISLCLIMSACCGSYDLKKNQISEMKVEFYTEDANNYIIISGTPFHSALVIKEIIITDLGSSINVKAKQQLCGSGIGLPLYIKIQIRKDINTVTLGENKEVIWKRNTENK